MRRHLLPQPRVTIHTVMVVGRVDVVDRLLGQEFIGVHACRVVADWDLRICTVLV